MYISALYVSFSLSSAVKRFEFPKALYEFPIIWILCRLCGNFSMDVIAGTAFGAHANTLENPDAPFNKHGIDAVRKNAWLHNVGGCQTEIYLSVYL